MTRSELREPSFLVLATLASGPRHGYALMQQIQQQLDDGDTIRAGTLYAALDRLTSEGLVVETEQQVVDGRLRRYYDLTDDGAAELARATARLRRNVSFANAGLRARGTMA
jgi:DNA-binding PadR family transcriptional regulator